MKHANYTRHCVSELIMQSETGISAWDMARLLNSTYTAIAKHIAKLRREGLPIDKTRPSGSEVLWCRLELLDTIRKRQNAEIQARRAKAKEKDNAARRERWHAKCKHIQRPPRKGRKPDPTIERQRVVSAATAPKLRQRLGPSSVFDLAAY